jgi:hypothetical protein
VKNGGRSPVAYLRARQQRDGSIRYSKQSAQTPVWVTAQAIMALRQKPLPFASVPRDSKARRPESSAPAASSEHGQDPKPSDKDEKKDKDEPAPEGAQSGVAGKSELGPPAPEAPDVASASTAAATTESGPDYLAALLGVAAVAAGAAAIVAWRRKRVR